MDEMRRSILAVGLAALGGQAIDAVAQQGSDTFRRGTVQANGLRFEYLEVGNGPLALCLHGFPDSPWTYRHLLPVLAKAGYRAVAPFMRGYAPTAIPADGDFSTRALSADVNALHEALGGTNEAILVAHDWGAAAAYGALPAAPQRWRKAVIGNVPHFAVFSQIALRYEQLKRSFYFWFFQMAIGEGIVAADDLAFLNGLWRDWSPGYDSSGEMEQVKTCLRDPAHLRAALGYYRTFFSATRFGTPEWAKEQTEVLGRPVPQPTLYLHGTQDGCIAVDESAFKSLPPHYGPMSQFERIEGVGHFFWVERPVQVNRLVIDFLKRS